MKDFLIAYDLKAEGAPHKRFLNEAVHEQLLYVLADLRTAHAYRLPNTTLWGQFENVGEAKQALLNVATRVEAAIKVKVVIEKFAITELTNARWNSDEKSPLSPAWTGSSRFETSKLHQLNDTTFA